MKNVMRIIMVAVSVAMLAGCGSAAENMLKSEEGRAELFERMAADSSLSNAFVQQLMSTEAGQGLVLDQIIASTEARQALIAKAAKDQTLVDGIVSVAVQNPEVRDHMITLFRGMDLGAGPR